MHLKTLARTMKWTCTAVNLTLPVPCFHSQVSGATVQTHKGLLQLVTCSLDRVLSQDSHLSNNLLKLLYRLSGTWAACPTAFNRFLPPRKWFIRFCHLWLSSQGLIWILLPRYVRFAGSQWCRKKKNMENRQQLCVRGLYVNVHARGVNIFELLWSAGALT